MLIATKYRNQHLPINHLLFGGALVSAFTRRVPRCGWASRHLHGFRLYRHLGDRLYRRRDYHLI